MQVETRAPEDEGAAQVSRDRASALRTVLCEMDGLRALRDALEGPLGEAFSRAVELLAETRGRAILTGVGKSGHVARKIAGTLASMGKPAHFLHPTDASHGDLGSIREEDVVVALSWSGETAEMAHLIAYTRRFAVPLVASTACAGSTLARAANVVLLLPGCKEACADSLAPTTSTTMQMAMGDALAVALLERSGFSTEDFRELHPAGRLGARLMHVRELMHVGDEMPVVEISATLQEAILRITGGRFGVAGVVDGGRLVGIVTDGDLRRAFERLQGRPFGEVGVAEAMGRSPRVCSPEELAASALARMNAEKITSLFVVEGEVPVGIVHIHDLLRAGVA